MEEVEQKHHEIKTESLGEFKREFLVDYIEENHCLDNFDFFQETILIKNNNKFKVGDEVSFYLHDELRYSRIKVLLFIEYIVQFNDSITNQLFSRHKTISFPITE